MCPGEVEPVVHAAEPAAGKPNPRPRNSRLKPPWTLGAVIAVTLSVSLGILAPIATIVHDHLNPEPASVHIAVTGLSSGELANVTVTDTDGFRRNVAIGGSLNEVLPVAGKYSLAASPVVTEAGTFYAVAPVVTLDASPTTVPVVDFNFADFISASTRVIMIPKSDTVSLRDPATSTLEELVIKRYGAPGGIQSGDFLASLPSDCEEDCYLVKVTQVLIGSAADEIFEVVPASFPDVLESAEIDIPVAADPESKSFPWERAFSCTREGDLRFSGSDRALERSMSLQIEWNDRDKPRWFKRPSEFRSATWNLTLGISSSATLSSSAAASCKGNLPSNRPVGTWPLPWIHIPVAVFHLAIKPVVELYLSGEVELTDRADVTVSANVGISLSAVCARGQGCERLETPDKETFTVNRDSAFQPETRVTGTFSISPELHLRIYGLAGPAAALKTNLRLNVSPQTQHVAGCVQGRIDFVIKHLDIRVPGFKVFSVCRESG